MASAGLRSPGSNSETGKTYPAADARGTEPETSARRGRPLTMGFEKDEHFHPGQERLERILAVLDWDHSEEISLPGERDLFPILERWHQVITELGKMELKGAVRRFVILGGDDGFQHL